MEGFGELLLVLAILFLIFKFLRMWFMEGYKSAGNKQVSDNRSINHTKNYQSKSDHSPSNRPLVSGEKKDTFEKGEAFENYLRDRVFNKYNFTLVEKTHNYLTNQSDFVESTLKPDFKFRDRRTGYEFHVEAKWRQSLIRNNLVWSNENQIKRYLSYSAEVPVYIVIGLGGEPSNPKYLYMEKIEKLNSCALNPEDLSQMAFDSQYKKYFLCETSNL